MIRRNHLGRRFARRSTSLVAASLLAAVVLLPSIASASSQSFTVLDSNTQPGMLMSLTANAGVVAPASDKTSASLIGVIGTDDVSFDQQPGQVSVQTDGAASTLVSTLNGDVLVGDRIAASELVGVGAKAASSGWIVGIAQGSLDSHTTGAVVSNVSDSQGKQHKVYIARIPVVVKVTYYTTATSASTGLPSSLQTAADSLAGKHASTLAIVLGFLLLLAGIILAGVLVNSAVRGGLSAIARQPLSKKVISRKVIQAFGISLAILISVMVGALLILRIF